MDSQLVKNIFDTTRDSMESANRCAKIGVGFVAGRLRGLSLDVYILRALKHELQSFDARRGKWKQR